MSPEHPQILFAVEMVSGDVSRRLCRNQQRALADIAERHLAPLQGRTTRSHSRGLGAAARACLAGPSQLGIDLEYLDPTRNWPSILHKIAGDIPDAHPARACSIWTLAEAWYKAFGHWPAADVLNAAARLRSEAQGVSELAPSTFWYAQNLAPGFQLSIVWRGTYITPQNASGTASSLPDGSNGSAP